MSTFPTGLAYWCIGPGGADGNVGPFSLNGPGLKDMDAALYRNVNFERGMTFQFRAEFTNVMNWVNLSNPSTESSRATTARSPGGGHPACYSVGRQTDVLILSLL